MPPRMYKPEDLAAKFTTTKQKLKRQKELLKMIKALEYKIHKLDIKTKTHWKEFHIHERELNGPT